MQSWSAQWLRLLLHVAGGVICQLPLFPTYLDNYRLFCSCNGTLFYMHWSSPGYRTLTTSTADVASCNKLIKRLAHKFIPEFPQTRVHHTETLLKQANGNQTCSPKPARRKKPLRNYRALSKKKGEQIADFRVFSEEPLPFNDELSI